MDTQQNAGCTGEGCCHKKWHHHKRCSGTIYGLGVIGAAVYYIQHAATFWAGVVGVLKAAVWPAFVVYHVFALWQL